MFVSETLRLDNGNASDASYFSSISVYRFGTWGQICGEFWDDQDATVACQQLGYRGGTASFFDRGQNTPLLVGKIECQGNETKLEDCEEREEFCYTSKVAGVFCYKSEGIFLDILTAHGTVESTKYECPASVHSDQSALWVAKDPKLLQVDREDSYLATRMCRLIVVAVCTCEPPHDKSIRMAGAPSEDSDQPGHPPSLISLHCPHEESLGP